MIKLELKRGDETPEIHEWLDRCAVILNEHPDVQQAIREWEREPPYLRREP